LEAGTEEVKEVKILFRARRFFRLGLPYRLRKKSPRPFVIPSEARNLSFFSWAWIEERFLASLGMTKIGAFSATGVVRENPHDAA
jgi:hypothetical protein